MRAQRLWKSGFTRTWRAINKKRTDKAMTKTDKKTNKRSLYDDLVAMAEEYNVADNTLFLAAANQYSVQQNVINMIKTQLDDDGSAVSTKEYVKGRENVYANPLIKELPKHSDSANKTLQTMLDIITKLGHKTETKSELSKFAERYE